MTPWTGLREKAEAWKKWRVSSPQTLEDWKAHDDAEDDWKDLAADQILALLDSHAKLVEALEPFSRQADAFGPEPADDVPLDCADYINVGDLRRARTALNTTKGG